MNNVAMWLLKCPCLVCQCTDTTGLKEMLEDECYISVEYIEGKKDLIMNALTENLLTVLSLNRHKRIRDQSWKYNIENVKLQLLSFYLGM